MNKGYFLDKWFRYSDRVHSEMERLFLKNNVSTFKLSLLPEKDRERWFFLKDKSDRIARAITELILNK